MSANPLAKLDQARAYLAECRSLPQVKQIRDRALAYKEYARAQRLGNEARIYAWEVQTEAEQRAAELLKQVERKPGAGGGNPNLVRQMDEVATPLQEALDEIGMSRQELSRWDAVSQIPATVRSRYVDEVRANNAEPTTKGSVGLCLRKERPGARIVRLERMVHVA